DLVTGVQTCALPISVAALELPSDIIASIDEQAPNGPLVDTAPAEFANQTQQRHIGQRIQPRASRPIDTRRGLDHPGPRVIPRRRSEERRVGKAWVGA